MSSNSLPSIDLSVFEHQHDSECTNDKDFKSCLPIKRLLASLRYYSLLNVLQNHNDCKLFEDFVFTVYSKRALINDYVHLSQQHAAQIEEIREYFIEQARLKAVCDLKQCAFTRRHQQVSNLELAVVVQLEPQLAQLCDMLDALHFYVLHLFEAGMRRTRKEQQEVETQSDSDGVEHVAVKHFDAKFAALTRWISARRHLTTSFDRFSSGTNSKFAIKLSENEKQTFLDSVCKQLQQSGVEKQAIARFEALLNAEEYDTDSVEADVLNSNEEGKAQGNISDAVKHKYCVAVIRNLFQRAKDSTSSFAAGFRFYYWSDFKTKTKEQDNNHPEYTVSQLYVAQKYQSFKEEIANYQAENFDLSKYNNKVRVKALDFITSNIVKKTKPGYFLCEEYGIPRDSTLAFRHLASLSMYCDFTHLSSKFSATFRKSHPFELLHETKRRNSEFWWFARSLRETVEIFGKNYADTKKDKYPFVGPFYCGLSFVMTVPQFSIELNGPTSTTMYEAVALKFSGPKGIILTLNNKTQWGDARYLNGFDCSWLSRYREEAERLFFGGYHPINIQSINIIKTKQNFADIICGLCYLDKLLSGQDTDGDKISEHQVAIFAAIYGSFCGESATQIELDAYIEQTLQQFVQNKTHISLWLSRLNNWANKEMVKLIMNEMEENKDKTIRSKEDQTNLPRAALLKTFKNVKEININTGYDHSISFLWFLELITGSSITKAVIDGNYGGWLDKLWSNEKEREEIVSVYKQQNYQIVKQKQQCVVSKIM